MVVQTNKTADNQRGLWRDNYPEACNDSPGVDRTKFGQPPEFYGARSFR